jgi:hypothetical protein
MVCECYRSLGFKQTIYDQTSVSDWILSCIRPCRLYDSVAAYKLLFKQRQTKQQITPTWNH